MVVLVPCPSQVMSRGRAGKAGENWGVKALDYQDYAVGSAQMNDTVTLGLG